MSDALVVTGITHLLRGFIGPTVRTGHQSRRGHDGGAVLIEHQGRGALIQEGPPWVFLVGVLPVCVWC
jgi:hypothetical protein